MIDNVARVDQIVSNFFKRHLFAKKLVKSWTVAEDGKVITIDLTAQVVGFRCIKSVSTTQDAMRAYTTKEFAESIAAALYAQLDSLIRIRLEN